MESVILKIVTAIIIVSTICFFGGAIVNGSITIADWTENTRQKIGGVWMFLCLACAFAISLFNYLNPD